MICRPTNVAFKVRAIRVTRIISVPLFITWLSSYRMADTEYNPPIGSRDCRFDIPFNYPSEQLWYDSRKVFPWYRAPNKNQIITVSSPQDSTWGVLLMLLATEPYHTVCTRMKSTTNPRSVLRSALLEASRSPSAILAPVLVWRGRIRQTWRGGRSVQHALSGWWQFQVWWLLQKFCLPCRWAASNPVNQQSLWPKMTDRFATTRCETQACPTETDLSAVRWTCIRVV